MSVQEAGIAVDYDSPKCIETHCYWSLHPIWLVGLLLGLSAGSQGYASGPDTLSWHFVCSDALRCWAPALLIGMAFLGLQKIIDLLKERGE